MRLRSTSSSGPSRRAISARSLGFLVFAACDRIISAWSWYTTFFGHTWQPQDKLHWLLLKKFASCLGAPSLPRSKIKPKSSTQTLQSSGSGRLMCCNLSEKGADRESCCDCGKIRQSTHDEKPNSSNHFVDPLHLPISLQIVLQRRIAKICLIYFHRSRAVLFDMKFTIKKESKRTILRCKPQNHPSNWSCLMGNYNILEW